MHATEISAEKFKDSAQYGISFFLGILISLATIYASTMDKKWLFAVLLAIVGIFCCFLLQNHLKVLLLAMAVFLIPLRIDFYLIYKVSNYLSSTYPGLPVTSFDLIFCALFIFWLFQVVKGEKRINFFPSITIPFILYFIFSGISAFHAADYGLSFSTLILMAKSYLIFLFFANTINSKKDILIIIMGISAGVWLQSFVGGCQYIGIEAFDSLFGLPDGSVRTQAQGGYVLSRVGGTFGHPNALAKYLGFCLLVLFAYSINNWGGLFSKMAMATFLLGGWTLLTTLTRGTWIAMGVSICFILYAVFKDKFKSRAKSIAMVFIVLAVLGGGIIATVEDVRHRLFEEDYRSVQSRIPMAMVALNIIRDHPITGVGLNNYTAVMHRYDRTREWHTHHFSHPVHNSYLLIAAESGIPALLAFLWVLTAAFAKARPALSMPGAAFSIFQIGWTAALMTWVIAGCFDRDFAGTNIMLWLTMGVLTALHHQMTRENSESSTTPKRFPYETSQHV